MAFDTTNLIPHLINLDFKESNFISIPVEQYDKDSAYIEATLYDGGSPYIIPEGSTASFGGTKPSSHIILETAVIENNKVYYKISEQCTVKEGDYPVKFTLYLPNNAVKYTQEFKIKVRKAVISSDAIADVDEVNVLNELIVNATEAIEDVNDATTNAINATNNANIKATFANEKAILADEKATLANNAATLANEKAGLANTATTNANNATDRANAAASNAEAVVVGKTGINDAVSNSTTEGWSSSKINGEIVNINSQLAENANRFKQTSEIKPLVSFVIDDGYTTDLTRLKPLFDSKGVVACTAMISDMIGKAGYLSLEQLMILKNAGWEIASHSKTHPNPYLSELTEPQIVEELKGSFDALNELGLEVETMVIPNSKHNALVREVSKRYYNATFTQMGSLIKVPINTHNLTRTLMGEDASAPYNTLEYYKSRVDLAVANNSWLVFCLHSDQFNGETQFDYLSQTIDYIQGLGIDIVTPKQGLEIYKNLLEVRNENTNEFTAIAKSGSIYSNRVPYLAIKLSDNTPITANSPFSEFPDNQISYLKILKANAAGFPENKAGILTTNKLVAETGYIYQEYYVYSTRNVYRRYVLPSQAWSTWEVQILGLPSISYTMTARTINANSSIVLSVSDSTIIPTHTHIAQPTGELEAGILWNCWSYGYGGLKIRLYNCTANNIDLAERVWKISRIRQ